MAVSTLRQTIASILKRQRLSYLSTPRREAISSIIIAPSYRVIYVVLPKCACTTIKAHLCNLDPILPLKFDDTMKCLDGLFRSVTKNVSTRALYEDYRDYTIFTFVRNPTARLISLYRDKVVKNIYPPFSKFGIEKEMEFEDFVKTICAVPDSRADPHFRSQYSYISYKGKLLPNFLGTVENIDHGLPYLLSTFKPDAIEGPLLHYNRKRDVGGLVEITPDIEAALKKRYLDDYRLHERISKCPLGKMEMSDRN